MSVKKVYDCLLLGGSGYIGSYLARGLIRLNKTVMSTDRNADIIQIVDQGKSVYYLLGQNGLRFNTEQELNQLKEVLKRIDPVVCKQFIFFSSALVYGERKSPASETDMINPLDIYSRFKSVCEHEILKQLAHTEIDIKILRLSNVFGGQGNKGFIGLLIRKAFSDTEPIININGDGSQLRDYIYIDDVVKSILLISEASGSDVVNVSSGNSHSLKEVVNIFNQVCPNKIKIKITGNKLKEVRSSIISNNRLVIRYGYQPKIDLATGLKTIIQEYGSK